MQPKQPILMPMTRYTLDDVVAIERACFPDPWGYAVLEHELNNPMAHYFVLMQDGVCAGFCGGLDICGEFEITMVAVNPAWRRRGFGHRLLDELIACARQMGDVRIHLEVRASNEAAIALYSRSGFCQVGRRRDYYAFPREDAVLMTLELTAPSHQILTEQKENEP